ncbi:immunoglobulin domain-containing protein, partial [Lacibacter sp. H407]|uniref:immunoglobulin domain-containing protein n=1 Tax=Lacibacter sp. H407 TaxID=3133423 RepID=UPI0030C1C192
MQQLLCLSVNQRAISALLTPFYFLFQSKKLLLRFAMLVMSVGMMNGVVGQATVTTDKPDYQPGDTVLITGTGWQPGETVKLDVDEEPKPTTCLLPHDLIVVADADGKIYSKEFLIKENHLGVTFTLTATGQSSGLVAVTTFTDALFFSASITSNPISICAGTNASYTITIKNNTTTGPGETPTGQNARLGSIRIAIPSGYTGIVITSNSPDWTVSTATPGFIEFDANGNDNNNNRIDPTESVFITFTAIAPITPINPYVWITEAWVGSNFTGTKYPGIGTDLNPGNQPNVIVNPNHSINLSSTSNNQTVCRNTAITDITFNVGGGATGANITGLPNGLSGSFNAGVFTITGTSSQEGIFDYTIITTGNSCTAAQATGTITIKGLLDYANLQFPSSFSICQGGNFTAYGRVYESGVTEANGAGTGIIAQIGYNNTNSDPSTWPEANWSNATYNTQVGNDDEYQASFGSSLTPGTYYYTFRYSLNGCQWQYGGYSAGGGNFWGGANVSGVLTVNANHTLSYNSGSTSQSICEGLPIEPIIYTIGGGAANVNVSGLPNGVVKSISGNTVTISGTPTVQFGTFNYTVTTTGNSCTTQSLGGTITVKSKLDVVNLQFPLTSTLCLGQPLNAFGQVYEPEVTPGNGPASPNIIAEFGVGTTNNTNSFTWYAASFNSAGSEGNNDEYQYAFTAPSVGTYYYTFRYSFNGCDLQYAQDIGVLTVNQPPTINLTSANNLQTVCDGVAINAITYSIGGGATGAGVMGLPTGLTGSYNSGVFTISGTPTQYGIFNYTVSTTGPDGCTAATATGTITVKQKFSFVNLQFPPSGTICTNQSFDVYGQVYAAGVTEAAGAGANIIAELGYSTTDTDPSTWGTWISATYNGQGGISNNNDEYKGTLSSLAPGTYYYTFRYKLNECEYQYGGTSGFWSAGQSGVLTVNALPVITSSPVNSTITYGTNASLSASATGTGPLTYQWQVNTGSGYTNISLAGIYANTDANPSTLEIEKPTVAMSGYVYRVMVSGACAPAAESDGAV